MTLLHPAASRNGALALLRATREARIVPPLRKLIVFMLATYADPDGTSICPSLKTIAKLTGLDVRSVRRHVRALEAEGVLVQNKPASRTRGAEFALMPDALKPDSGVRPCAPKPDSGPLKPDSGDTETGLTSPPTCDDLKNLPEDTTARPSARQDRQRPQGQLDFEELRAVYPKRGGAQPWSRAVKAANKRIREGVRFNTMIEGARRYAGYCEATGKVGTEFVMQAATFLGPDQHYLEPWTLQGSDEYEPDEFDASVYTNADAVKRWRQRRDATGPSAQAPRTNARRSQREIKEDFARAAKEIIDEERSQERKT